MKRSLVYGLMLNVSINSFASVGSIPVSYSEDAPPKIAYIEDISSQYNGPVRGCINARGNDMEFSFKDGIVSCGYNSYSLVTPNQGQHNSAEFDYAKECNAGDAIGIKNQYDKKGNFSGIRCIKDYKGKGELAAWKMVTFTKTLTPEVMNCGSNGIVSNLPSDGSGNISCTYDKILKVDFFTSHEVWNSNGNVGVHTGNDWAPGQNKVECPLGYVLTGFGNRFSDGTTGQCAMARYLYSVSGSLVSKPSDQCRVVSSTTDETTPKNTYGWYIVGISSNNHKILNKLECQANAIKVSSDFK